MNDVVRVGRCRVNRCYYCICKTCNMLHCRQKTHFERCWFCHERGEQPTTDCDHFTPKYTNHVYRKKRIRRKGKPLIVQIDEKLDELQKSINEMSKGG